MKELIPLKDKANPTKETQEKVLEVIKRTEKPLTITGVAQQSGVGFYQTRVSIDFLKSLGVLETIKTEGNVTIVFLKKNEGEKCQAKII